MDGFEKYADFEKEGHVLDVKKIVLQFFNGIFNRCTKSIIHQTQQMIPGASPRAEEKNGRKWSKLKLQPILNL